MVILLLLMLNKIQIYFGLFVVEVETVELYGAIPVIWTRLKKPLNQYWRKNQYLNMLAKYLIQPYKLCSMDCYQQVCSGTGELTFLMNWDRKSGLNI